MNKAILLALVVLVAAQCVQVEAGFFSDLLGLVFSLVLGLLGIVINLTVSVTQTILVVSTVVQTVVSQTVVTAISTVSTAVSVSVSIVVNIFAQNNATISKWAASLKSQTNITEEARTIGIVINSVNEEITIRISFMISSIAAALVGRSQEKLLLSEPYESSYPESQCLAPSSSNSSNSTTISCQCLIVSQFVKAMIRDLNATAQDFEDLVATTNASCSMCPNSTNIQTAISAWAAVDATLQNCTNITTKGQLVKYLNETNVLANFTSAMNETQKVMEQSNNCTECVLSYIVQKGTKKLRDCGKAMVGQGKSSNGADESFSQCVTKVKKSHDRRRKAHMKYLKYKVKQFRMGQKHALGQACQSAMAGGDYISQMISDFIKFLLQITQVAIRKALNDVNSTLVALSNATNQTTINVTVLISQMVNQSQINNNATIQNASSTLIALAENLTNLMVNETELYPGCSNFSNIPREIMANLSKDLASCLEISNNVTFDIVVNITVVVSAIVKVVGDSKKDIQNCVDAPFWPFSATIFGLNTAWAGWPVESSIVSCIGGVNNRVKSQQASINVTLSATITAAQKNCTDSEDAIKACAESKLVAAITALEKVKTDYETCKASQTTTPATTAAPTTAAPTTAAPTTVAPTDAPTTAAPTVAPTDAPTTVAPTVAPTEAPTTVAPTTAAPCP